MTHDGAKALEAAGYAWEIADAPLLHVGLNLADIAHVLELRRLGVLPSNRLVRALVDLADTSADDVGYSPERGEVYTSREVWLRERVGDDAGWLHVGRTRREAVRTAFRIATRNRLADLLLATANLGEALCARAGVERETVMPDYTYLQPAQVSTLGHYLLSFNEPLARDARRLIDDMGEVDQSLAGSGAANGSALPIDRERMAGRLGFASVVEHLRDAMWQTDPFLHACLDATSLVLSQDRLAEDLEIFTSHEFAFVSLGDDLVRPSVLMPQKRNPYALTVVRGSAAILIGRATGQLALAKSPSARSDALIYAYGEVPRALELATRVTTVMTSVVHSLQVHPERMSQALIGAHLEATDVATLLSTEVGIDYGTAHAIVKEALQGEAQLDADRLSALTTERVGRRVDIDPTVLDAMRTPRAALQSRRARGGPLPEEVERLAAVRISEWASVRSQVTAAQRRWNQAEEELLNEARAVLRPPTDDEKRAFR